MKHLIEDIDKLFDALMIKNKPIKHYITVAENLIKAIDERKIHIDDSINAKHCILAITETIANFNINRRHIKSGIINITKEEYCEYIKNINKLKLILFSMCNSIIELAKVDSVNKDKNKIDIDNICKKYNISKEELRSLLL